MCGKCYPNITACFGAYGESQAPSDEKWRVFRRFGSRSCLMVQNISGEVKFAPLFIHSFPLLALHHLLESEKFNIRFVDPSEITEIVDNMYQRPELDYFICSALLDYADLVLNSDPETYLKIVTEYKPLY